MLEGSILARFLFKSFVSILYTILLLQQQHLCIFAFCILCCDVVCDMMIDEVKVLKNSRVLMHSKILFF